MPFCTAFNRCCANSTSYPQQPRPLRFTSSTAMHGQLQSQSYKIIISFSFHFAFLCFIFQFRYFSLLLRLKHNKTWIPNRFLMRLKFSTANGNIHEIYDNPFMAWIVYIFLPPESLQKSCLCLQAPRISSSPLRLFLVFFLACTFIDNWRGEGETGRAEATHKTETKWKAKRVI